MMNLNWKSYLKSVENTIETPCYFYDLNLLKKTLQEAKEHSEKYGFHVHYALKANFDSRVLKCIKDMGFGADCVSGNEVKKSIESGFDPSKIVFAGVGKSDKEILYALDQDIFAFNVESIQEIEVINELAEKQGKVASIALRFNPNVDAKTHKNITTGLEENKFGIPYHEVDRVLHVLNSCKNIRLKGIHFHIGSQILELEVFNELCVKVNELNAWFLEKGHDLEILNVGGGLGVDYQNPDQNAIPDFAHYFRIFHENLNIRENQEVHFELGRSLVGQCGILLSRVLYVKEGKQKDFLILDAGMTELMRPALYQAFHKIEKLHAADEEELHGKPYDVVGPICESTDVLGAQVILNTCKRGDMLLIRTAGAYGEVMASGYNLRNEIRQHYFESES